MVGGLLYLCANGDVVLYRSSSQKHPGLNFSNTFAFMKSLLRADTYITECV